MRRFDNCLAAAVSSFRKASVKLEEQGGVFLEIDCEGGYRFCGDDFAGIKLRDFCGARQRDAAWAWFVHADGEHGLVGPDDIWRFDVLMDSRKFGEIAIELSRQLRLCAIDGCPVVVLSGDDGGLAIRICREDNGLRIIGDDGGNLDILFIAKVLACKTIAEGGDSVKFHISFDHRLFGVEREFDACEGFRLVGGELSIHNGACVVEENDDATVVFHLVDFFAELS